MDRLGSYLQLTLRGIGALPHPVVQPRVKVFRVCAEVDPKAVASCVLSFRPGSQKYGLLGLVAAGWAAQEPDGAIN
jgi:hypothetical protein